MLRRSLVLASVGSLLLIPAISDAAVKSGAACKKLGQTEVSQGKKYTCVKLKSKLVWNKGVLLPVVPKEPAVPASTPSPTPSAEVSTPPKPVDSPSPSPTPVKKTLFELWLETGSKAIGPYSIWVSNLSSGKPETKMEYWFGATVPTTIQAESKMRFENAVLQWERFYKIRRSKVYFDLGMKNEIKDRCEVLSTRSASFTVNWCLGQAEPELKRFFYVAAAYESEGGWRPILDPNLSKNASVSHSYNLNEPIVFYTDNFYPRIEHEWFHQIQYDLTGNNLMREFPVWFVEGSAEYFGLLAAASKDPDQFIRIRAQMWYPWNETLSVDFFKKWIKDQSFTRLLYGNQAQTKTPDFSIYNTGAMLTEWLVGKIGFQGVISLMRDTESMGWTESFKKNVGASQDVLLDEMANYLYTEFMIVDRNRSIVMLPQCKSYRNGGYIEVNKGVCLSGDGLLGN